MRRWLLALFVATLVISPPASAKPIGTDLATIRADAVDIVIGTIPANNSLAIDIDTVIRGTASLGMRTMKATPDEAPRAHGRVLALIDAQNQFRWVGNLVAGQKIETGVLQLGGFYDYNAHFVYPASMMTLAQFKDYLATGKLTQHFEVKIHAEDLRGGYVATGESFDIDYEPFQSNKSTINNFRGACLGNGSLSGLSWESPQVAFSSTCPGGNRQLQLYGRPIGVNGKGDIMFTMMPRTPFLDVKDFPTYFKDGSYGDVKRVLDLQLADGTKWTWQTDIGLIDPKGTVHSGTSLSSGSYGFEPGIEVSLVGGDNDGASSDPAWILVRQIDAGTSGTCSFKQTGHPVRACTLGRGVSKFVKR